MKGTRALSFLLALAMVASLVIPGSLVLPAKAEDADNGMRLSKTATKNEDGTYTITLEAYATGSKVISEVKSDVPADIVLVLDQSGSMEDDMGTVSFELYKDGTDWWGNTTYHTRNQDYYEVRHNGGSGNLWHKLEDRSYVSVSVTIQEVASYKDLSSSLKNYTTEYQYGDDYYGDITEDCYYYYANNLYEKVGEDSYQKVELKETSSGPFWDTTYTYTYSFADGTSVSSTGRAEVPKLGDHAPLYYKTVDDVYTYTYTDASGNVVTIGTSAGASTVFTPTLYKRNVSTSGGGSRLSALSSAVTTFANTVAEKAKGADGILGTDDDVQHRVAVVGFASESGYGNNTELLSIAGSNSGSVGVAYNAITDQNLKDVLQDMTTTNGQQMVQRAINALAAEGATEADLGMDMANRILNANPVSDGETRTRVVVFFTDGSPTSSNGFETGVANDAISKAGTIKAGGASVYSVGIFQGADATSAGNSGGTDTQKANWFMQNVSSNNGSVRTPSYYLSASDAGTLSTIFQQIASNIESGGSSATLTDQAVVKDIIAPQFTLPIGATADDITLKTYDYIGENQWSKNVGDAMGATATVYGDQVSVTGFNFSENWCGTVNNNGKTEYRGSKLVISFTVAMKTGFLGGNGVETNASAGVYENSSATDPIMTFEKPTVDIPIENVTVTPEAKNVYLLQDVSADTLKSGATVTVGGVSLDLSQENYGLESWQTAYVDITVEVKDANNNEVTTDLTGLTDDSTYSITVTVTPKTKGTVDAKSGTGDGAINVFKPVLTYKDSSVYYGDDVPTNFSGNLASTEWKHGDTLDSAVTMIGTAPTLTTTNTPDSSKIANGKINTKQNVPVNVTVGIGGTDVTVYTTFAHQDCVTNELLNGGKFLLHVNTCQLTITKTGGADGEPYVFNVLKDGEEYTEVTVMGGGRETIVELPVGSYTIAEDTRWSWRYSGNNGSAAVLSADSPSGTITCTNSLSKEYWLNGFSDVVKNIYRNNAG